MATASTLRRGTTVSSLHHGSSPLPPRSSSLAKLLLLAVLQASIACARPVSASLGLVHTYEDDDEEPPAELWIYLTTAIFLVVLGGAFAGLTIALMGQDEIYLQVIATSGEGAEKKYADKVFKLLQRGKHWVLVTLLVGNVITNETLPIVLDRSIGGGYAAAISSTVLVIIFGEIVPQSICVRFGLPIGAWMSPFVLVLMWLTSPITWPIAKLLDYLLGEEHGTTYKKAGLKTLVTLHKTMGSTPGDRLNEDEAQIISGVLDLKEKPVGSIMTPMVDVFTLPSDAILDEELMDDIMREGYSRIPIHQPNKASDFVGMLLVKMLITYDPEDAKRVNEFALATLPETAPDTSCLDIINFFQQGKSHMVLVSDQPGSTEGALGVVTLEDVIEELIGEEIIDESDVYIDIHKAIRRGLPAPIHHAHSYVPKSEIIAEPTADEEAANNDGAEPNTDKRISQIKIDENSDPRAHSSKRPSAVSLGGSKPRMGTFLLRRKSSGSGSQNVRSVKMGMPEMREAMKKLGPSNLASQPKQTRFNTIKVKPGTGSGNVIQTAIPEHSRVASPGGGATTVVPEPTEAQLGIGQDQINPGLDARDGVHTVNTGSWNKGSSPGSNAVPGSDGANGETQALTGAGAGNSGYGTISQSQSQTQTQDTPSSPQPQDTSNTSRQPLARSTSHSTIGSLHSASSSGSPTNITTSFWRGRNATKTSSSKKKKKTATARSGSITESFVETGGVKKLVLQPTESASTGSSEEDGGGEVATTGSLDVSGGGEGKMGYGSPFPKAVHGHTSDQVSEQAMQEQSPRGNQEENGEGGNERSASASAKGPKRRKRGKRQANVRSGGDGVDEDIEGEKEGEEEGERKPLLGGR